MTVDELLSKLQELKDQGLGEAPVHFAYNYGDYSRTLVAPSVDTIDLANLRHSDYHGMERVVSVIGEFDEDEDEEKDGDITAVLIR